MGIETRLCPVCGTPTDFDVPTTEEQAAYRIDVCSGCGRELFYIPGENTTHWDLLA